MSLPAQATPNPVATTPATGLTVPAILLPAVAPHPA